MTSFNDRYAVGKQIGKGGFGKVFSGQRRADGLAVAIKFISKRRVVLWHSVRLFTFNENSVFLHFSCESFCTERVFLRVARGKQGSSRVGVAAADASGGVGDSAVRSL